MEPSQQSATLFARPIFLLGSLVLALLCGVLVPLFSPGRAYATFKDVADSYPAAQELGSYDDPISGDELPDGAYKVVARTTSRMCILYTDPADAEARDSKEQAIVTVNDGQLTAVFYISKAYTHLYLGTQEEAAAETNKEGTDASAYIAGDPDEGYVPHMFALPIDALNEPITVSTYSGGDKGLENGKWYTRELVFKMTDAELRAAVEAAEEPDPSSESGEEEGSDDDDGSGEEDKASSSSDENAGEEDEENGSEKGSSSESVEKEDDSSDDVTDESNDGKNASKADDKSSSSSQVALNAGNVKADDDDGDSEDEGEEQSGEQAASTQPTQDSGQGDDSAGGDIPENDESTTTVSKTMRGVRMNISNPQVVIDVSNIERQDTSATEKFSLTPTQVLGLSVIALILVGIIARCVLFSRGFERTSTASNGEVLSVIEPDIKEFK